MQRTAMKVHPDDDVIVALRDHTAGEVVIAEGAGPLTIGNPVAAKHKFAARTLRQGELVRMYGIVIGRAVREIVAGQPVTTANLQHAVGEMSGVVHGAKWTAPDVSDFRARTFQGYHRPDGRVGTRNYWIFVPLVFCENRNLQVIAEALLQELGYARDNRYRQLTRQLVGLQQQGHSADAILQADVDLLPPPSPPGKRVFSQLDGIKFLRHEGGCGGTYEDAKNLCGLFAGYINHPNVAGATVLSLGCQKSQIELLESELHKRNPRLQKPLYIFEQQKLGTEENLITTALRHTLVGLMQANQVVREAAELRHLTLGVECGGSDGFSGLSANPAIGHCSDLLVALGGSVILSEFPELAGCEGDLTSRCVSRELADRFLHIMREYDRRAVASGGGFDSNPSPGNIRDGLITDAMKSAGAAKKGGTSPVTDVLDYPEPATKPGLTLLCTPGGDVESTTAMAGSGANIQWFSTGLGTPTGNVISPVLKVSSNSHLAERMPDIIDLNAGSIISGDETIAQVGRRMLEMLIDTASGTYLAKAEQLGQDDFIPWKRGMSF